MQRYGFDWALVGDIIDGRPNLGPEIGVNVYRLVQFTLRDVIEKKYSAEIADEIFYAAGKLAGRNFYKYIIHPVNTVEEFIGKTQKVLKENKIGVLRMEETDMDEGRIVLTMDEDLDCSGMPELEYETCVYDEGFVASLLEEFTGQTWTAKEIDCWCTGARTCRFLLTRQ